MADGKSILTRRTALKGLGGAVTTAIVGGAGFSAFVGSAAASSSIDIESGDVNVSTDHGEIDRVWVEPSITGSFNGFDETVGKVRIFIEAAPHDVEDDNLGDFAPVFRATMWLNETSISGHEVESGPGYHGDFAAANNEPNEDGHYWFGADGLTLYDREGPDYGALENPASFFDGTSVGQEFDDENDPDSFENGMYEQAGTVDRFFNAEDGTDDTTTVTLRYTISFHAPNSSIADGYDIPAEDVAEQSPLVMVDAPDVDNPINTDNYAATSIPYSVLRDHADGHPAIIVAENDFDVVVHNEPAESDPSVESGTGAVGSDDTSTTTK